MKIGIKIPRGWHKWFAWYPIFIFNWDTRLNYFVWLRFLERKEFDIFETNQVVYRFLPKKIGK